MSNKVKTENIPIGNRLKEEREKRGIAQQQLAQQLDYGRTMISRYETGVSEIPLKFFELLSEKWGLDTAVYIQYGKQYGDTQHENVIDLRQYSFDDRQLFLALAKRLKRN